MERDRLFRKYVMSAPEPISSSFNQGDLATWVVRLLRQVEGIPRNQVASLLINTYGGYLQARRDHQFAPRIEAMVPELLGRMERTGLLQEDSSKGVFLTPLGSVCGQSNLGFESCLRLPEALRTLGDGSITPETLLGVVQSLPESDGTYVPMQKKGAKDLRWPETAVYRLGRAVVSVMTRGADAITVSARAKRTLIALAWAEGREIERIEGDFTVNPFFPVAAGDVRSIAESTRFRLRSAYEIATVAHPNRVPSTEAMNGFFQQLEFGIPGTALELISLPFALSRAEYLLLHGRGLSTPQAVWSSPWQHWSETCRRRSLRG
jgi:hypothetical protein